MGRERKYLSTARFPSLKYAQLWKKDVKNTKMQAGCDLLDFCTDYGSMLITFFRLLSKKILFFTAMMHTV
jgi:hypothetical protein